MLRWFSPLLIVLAILLPHLATGVVIVVSATNDELNSDGDCSLREAVQAANTDTAVDACPAGSGADRIELPGPGTYTLTISGESNDDNTLGDLDVRSDLTIVGTGSERSTISHPGLGGGGRILHIRCDDVAGVDIDVVLHRLVLHDGGTQLEGGNLLIESCTGADANVRIVDSVIEEGLASGLVGGGIAMATAGTVSLYRTVVRNNAAVDQGHPAPGGAGIYQTAGLLHVIESEISGNTATEGVFGDQPAGGGIWTSGSLTLERSTIVGNSAVWGGGIACFGGFVDLDNVTVTGNTASLDGGGIVQGREGSGCVLVADSSTITDNDADHGGGWKHEGGLAGATNTIIAGNLATDATPLGHDVLGAFGSGDYNLVGNGDDATGFTEPDDQVGSTGSEIDPLLAPRAYDGYPTRTHRTLTGSPARDSGDSGFDDDQRREPRPVGGSDDRGAVEFRDRGGIWIDLANFFGSPTSAFEGAAGVAGTWNTIGLGSHALLDHTGAASGVSVTVSSESDSALPSSGVNDASRLLSDHVSDCTDPDEWSLSFTGLPDGGYTLYLFAPFNANVQTGDLSVGGVPLANLAGDTLTLQEGLSYRALFLVVSDGTLDVSGVGTGATDCAGLAGLQLVPEPGRVAGLASGIGLLLAIAWRRAKSARGRGC